MPLAALHEAFGGTSKAFFVPDPSEPDARIAVGIAKVLNESRAAGCSRHDQNAFVVERAAEVFSKAIAENDFKGLPHVNSPQNLVKNLVRGKTKK